MLNALRIENFRCFKTFELLELGRLNLLVGTNNSGKTSILEAIYLLMSQSKLQALREIMIGRGEFVLSDERVSNRELEVHHLFYGHEIDIGSNFSIFGDNRNNGTKTTISVENTGDSNFSGGEFRLVIVDWPSEEEYPTIKIPLSSEGGLQLDYLRRTPRDFKESGAKTQFVTSNSWTTEKMIELFDRVVLTPEEDLVTEALQTIEPDIDRIAAIASDNYRRYTGSRSGFVVKIANGNQRVPIGSMGDGIWRMLGLTLAIVNARNGVLLVDEIDTGLHFSAMSDMWKLIWETAKKLNVQVFATTHNSDCWTSLATIANTETPSEEGITIQRIEKGKSSSVVFTERQVVIAAERGIEVR